MLELRAIGKRLGSFELQDINLKVEAAEYFVLMGPSGAGKTILLELIAGLISADQGQIIFEAKDITKEPSEKRGISVVYQDYCLFPHMTVHENIAYGLKSQKVEPKQIAEDIQTIATTLEITHLLDRQPETLSGGEKQRVAIARALVTKPKILLLDEPLAALDANIKTLFRKVLKRIQKETKTAFIHVTHDAQECLYLGDHAGVILNQTIAQTGSPDQLFRRPADAQVANFLGMQNIYAIDRQEDGVCWIDGIKVHATDVTMATSHVWIKPEEIILSKEPFDSSARNQYKCKIKDWESLESHLAVRFSLGNLSMTTLITHQSFENLKIAKDRELFCTFKSTSVFCF
jgi:molybdate/tungstate transport system ATP-binding protein